MWGLIPLGVSLASHKVMLVKGHCGRPKTSNTEGYACMQPKCDYRRITDSKVHVLMGTHYFYGTIGVKAASISLTKPTDCPIFQAHEYVIMFLIFSK